MCFSWLCPHGQAQHKIEKLASLAPTIIDLSADFRLHDTKLYETWYGAAACLPGLAGKVRLRSARIAPAGIAQRPLRQRRGLQCHRQQPGPFASGQGWLAGYG